MPTIKKQKRNCKSNYKKHGKQGYIQKLYNSSSWQNLRKSKLMTNPLCQNCEKNGITSLATCVHHCHIISDASTECEMMDLAYNFGNLLSLCEECHQKMHKLAKQKNLNYIDFIKLDDNNIQN